MRRTRLSPVSAKRAAEIAAGEHPRGSTFKRRRRWSKKATRERRMLRKAERWRRVYGPDDFVPWLKSQPCERCGAGPCEVHHEPPRSQGGRWIDTLPLCRRCHGRRHRVGVLTFWGEMPCGSRSYGDVTRRVQGRWLAREWAA